MNLKLKKKKQSCVFTEQWPWFLLLSWSFTCCSCTMFPGSTQEAKSESMRHTALSCLSINMCALSALSSLFDLSLQAPASLSEWQAPFTLGMVKKFQCPLSQSSAGAQTAAIEWTVFWVCKSFSLTTLNNIVQHVCWCHMLETENITNSDVTLIQYISSVSNGSVKPCI